MSFAPNETLLHYRIVEKIGEGGMGENQIRGYFPAGDDRFIVVVPAGDEEEDAARSGIKVVQSWFREFE